MFTHSCIHCEVPTVCQVLARAWSTVVVYSLITAVLTGRRPQALSL